MSKQDEHMNKLMLRGIIDSRKQAVIGNAKKLPNGEFGLCLMAIKGNYLNIYDTDMKSNVGQHLYSIDLTQITDVKSSSFVFNRYLTFTYKNFKYKFVDFGAAKEFIDTVNSEMK